MEDKKMVLPKFFQIEVDLKDNQIVSIVDINENPITEDECRNVFDVLFRNKLIQITNETTNIRICGHGDGTEEYIDIWTMDRDGEILLSDGYELSPTLPMDEFLNLK